MHLLLFSSFENFELIFCCHPWVSWDVIYCPEFTANFLPALFVISLETFKWWFFCPRLNCRHFAQPHPTNSLLNCISFSSTLFCFWIMAEALGLSVFTFQLACSLSLCSNTSARVRRWQRYYCFCVSLRFTVDIQGGHRRCKSSPKLRPL